MDKIDNKLEGAKNAISFPQMEEDVLKFWQESRIFEKSVEREAPQGDYVFYDGPPFITGLPHYATLLPSIIKDVVPRYWTMRGYRVERVWGWDCHGLPAENKVEKELGLRNKKDITELGVDKFINACHNYVKTCSDQWEWYVDRIGRWVDMKSAYKTMDLNFMESVMWSFKELYNKGLIYEGYRSSLHCPRCATPLSKFEITMDEGSYKDVTDKTVVVKFKLQKEKDTYVLAWTTTPWTLPGNLALAVGKDINYVKIEIKNQETGASEFFILAKDVIEAVDSNKKILAGQEYKIISEIKGKDLVGMGYEPLFDLKNQTISNDKNAFKIYAADFVTTVDGTGIVHIAPNFGEDDFELGKKNKLSLVELMDENGIYTKESGDWEGLHFKKANDRALNDLGDKLFASFDFTHSYPFCYRCQTSLIYKTQKAWYLNIKEIRKQLVKSNESINWVPEHFKEGRFKYNLESAPDWCVSRSRYWGSPIPVWRCECGEQKVIGSIEELKQETGGKITKIILVRHGEASHNTHNMWSCSLNTHHLTEDGKKQAANAAGILKDEKIDLIYSSTIARAQETAAVIAGKINKKVESTDALSEICSGDWEEESIGAVAEWDDRKKYKAASPEEQYSMKRGGTGESWEEVEKRSYNFVKKLVQENKGKTIVLISHQGIIAYLIKALRDLNIKETKALFDQQKYRAFASPITIYVDSLLAKEVNLHKHKVDALEFDCKCGQKMKRVPEILDCWFESGSMPFAQWHYPFERKDDFKKIFPADFIVEYTGQLRGWFYYLHVLANSLFDSVAFKNVIATGVLAGTDGRKMSKSYGNYPDPKGVLQKYGSDALRYYFMSSPIMIGEDMNFSEKDIEDALRKNVMLLWNVYKFYETYADINIKGQMPNVKSQNILDKWILAKLNILITSITSSMNKYDLPGATRPIKDFIDDLSTWYLRRSRDRFKSDDVNDKEAAINTTGFVLLQLSKIMAPTMPFIAEQIWQRVGGNNFNDENQSVHLQSWPDAVEVDEKIITDTISARIIVEQGLCWRADAGIKVRQPLLSYTTSVKSKLSDELVEIIKDELNVKEIIFGDKDELNVKITEELKAEGISREIIRAVNAMRKDANLTPSDLITLYIQTESEMIKNVLQKFGEDIRKSTISKEIKQEVVEGVRAVKINDEEVKMVVVKC